MENRRSQTRFHARTNLERELITPINAKYGARAALAGMTRGAIESWRLRASAEFPRENVEEVASLLIEASTRAEILTDDSRDVFEESSDRTKNSMDEIVSQLMNALRSSSPP